MNSLFNIEGAILRNGLCLLFIWIYINSVCAYDKKFSDEMLKDPLNYKSQFDNLILTTEKEVLSPSDFSGHLLLRCEYADFKIQNPIVWEGHRERVIPIEVKVVFSKYPLDFKDWKTDYYVLLTARLKALFAIAPELNNKRISYSILLQSGIKTENEAKDIFHGFFVKYEYIDAKYKNLVFHSFDSSYITIVDTLQLINGFVPNQSGDCGAIFEITSDFINYKGNLWVTNLGLGVFYSKDSGLSFQEINKGIEVISANIICIHKDRLFLGSRGTLYVYEDKNEYWKLIKRFDETENIQFIESNGEKIVIGLSNGVGLFMSDDGYKWNKTEIKTIEKNKANFVKLGNTNATWYQNHLFVSSGTKLYHSVNYGDTWREINYSQNKNKFTISSILATDFFIIVNTQMYGIYISKDNAKTWNNISTSFINGSGNAIFADVDKVIFSYYSIDDFTNSLYLLNKDGIVSKIAIGYYANSIYKYGSYYFLGGYGGIYYRLKINSNNDSEIDEKHFLKN